jgi:hypothetical protein
VGSTSKVGRYTYPLGMFMVFLAREFLLNLQGAIPHGRALVKIAMTFAFS